MCDPLYHSQRCLYVFFACPILSSSGLSYSSSDKSHGDVRKLLRNGNENWEEKHDKPNRMNYISRDPVMCVLRFIVTSTKRKT